MVSLKFSQQIEPNALAAELIFGSPEPKVQYAERRAAYVVIIGNDGMVAMVKGVKGLPAVKGRANAFLPGGGSLPGEAPEDTVAREVAEELARSVRLIRRLGEATQYFYADSDSQHYKMQAVFFAGEFVDVECGAGDISGEHELYWLTVTEAEKACFHPCHAWAVHQVAAASG